MLLDHNFNMTNVFDILFYWVSQSEECNQNLQNLTKLAGKRCSFKTLKQKKVVFMKKYHFKAVFEKKQACTYTEYGFAKLSFTKLRDMRYHNESVDQLIRSLIK